MAEVRVLRTPPIVEALLDVRFSAPDSPQDAGILKSLAGHICGEGCEVLQIGSVEAMVALSDLNTRNTVTFRGADGFIAVNKAVNRIVSVASQKLTVGQRAPYEGWDSIFANLQNAFSAFKEKVDPKTIVRISARFVNRIEIPFVENVDLGEYIEWSIGVPAALPWPTVEFNHRTVLHDAEQALFAIVVMRDNPLQQRADNEAFVVVDIDVISQNEIACDFTKVSEVLEKVRSMKNRIFFGMVTEKALEKYS